MGLASRRKLKDLKAEIVVAFHSTGKRIFTYDDLREILSENIEQWNLPASASLHDFLQFLVEAKIIAIEELKFPSRAYVKYVRGNVSIH